MTTEEKAKAYGMALEAAREELKQDLHESGVWAIKRIFPELRESEDERIRKLLVALVTVAPTFSALAFTMKDSTDCLSYLEKQKEQKPAEWGEEDNLMLTAIIQTLERFGGRGTTGMQIDWLKSLRPSWKPSEDEERLINTSISFLKDFADKGYENAVECIDWLKSKLNGNSGK